MSTTPTTQPASPVDPNAAAPRMIIWTTLRCLELQIDQHEERYNSDGVVSWELIKHMVRVAKRHAHEEGGKAEAAERETDQWRTRADEANAKIRQLETELQAALSEAAQAGARWADVVSASTADVERLREYEQATAQMNSALESARSDANLQAVRLAAAQRDRDRLRVDNHTLAITLQCLRRFASAIQRAKHKYKHLDCQGANEEIEAALAQLQATDAMAAAQVAGVRVAWCGDNVQPDPPTVDSKSRNYGPSPLQNAEAVRSEVAQLRKQLDQAAREYSRLEVEHTQQWCHLQAANADAVALRRCLGQIREQLAQMDDPHQTDFSLLQKIYLAVAEFDATASPQPPTENRPAVTEPLDDSSGADGPGQS